MNLAELSAEVLATIVVVLVFMSAYFSGSETAMVALNRYRLRHLHLSQLRVPASSHRPGLHSSILIGRHGSRHGTGLSLYVGGRKAGERHKL